MHRIKNAQQIIILFDKNRACSGEKNDACLILLSKRMHVWNYFRASVSESQYSIL